MPSPPNTDTSWLIGPADGEAHAWRAVTEELDEVARMEADLRVRVEQQALTLKRARTVLVLIPRSRVYRVLRALGRWGWLERRINQALR